MSKKEDILDSCRKNTRERFEMPVLDDIAGITYPDPLRQFIYMSESVGGKVRSVLEGEDVNSIIRDLFPDAVNISSNLPEINIATSNPDTVECAQALDGTEVGVVRGAFGVAENGCIWIHQTMKEKAVCFISENLVILLQHTEIVNNMHEAYKRLEFNDYGFGTFISGPSKTADIAQVLVVGAQAARTVTILIQ